MRRHKGLLFLALCTFIGLVSVYDGYLVERYSEIIIHMEENPVGSYLLHMAHGDTSLFLRVKAAGTVVVLGALAFLYLRVQRWAFPVAHSVAAFQFTLLLYLTFSLPTPPIGDDDPVMRSVKDSSGETSSGDRGRASERRSQFSRRQTLLANRHARKLSHQSPPSTATWQ